MQSFDDEASLHVVLDCTAGDFDGDSSAVDTAGSLGDTQVVRTLEVAANSCLVSMNSAVVVALEDRHPLVDLGTCFGSARLEQLTMPYPQGP